MQRLILVRHGEHYHTSLNNRGRAHIARLGEALKPTINGGRILILTSTATRARESAEILGQILGVEIGQNEILGDGNYSEDMKEELDLICSNKESADVLILVTHLEQVTALPWIFGKEELRVNDFPCKMINKGEAWDIDCEQKTITLISV